MQPKTHTFKANVREALTNEPLKAGLARLSSGFVEKRRLAAERLPEFETLRDEGRDIKDHVLDNLDHYLVRFEERVTALGGHVHWCRDADEACKTVLGICKDAGARTVTKGKSMIGEEIGINAYLEAGGVTPVETDLGEYIIQLRNEPPAHIVVPAFHLSKEQIAENFREAHTQRPADRDLQEPRVILEEAREELRGKFLAADVGLSGANMLIAETGTVALVTNEGNADLTVSLPKTHVVMASIEKIVPTLDDAATLLRLLARSATGQDLSVYTSFLTGPKRDADLDGPENFHVVLIDNGRTELMRTGFRDMLRCIRCGACLNHCPVFQTIGGHAYGWVYPGPMGSVLSPGILGPESTYDLPNASTLCGRCEDVCPVRIPLPSLLRLWREKQFAAKITPKTTRFGLKAWAWFASKPALYRLGTSLDVRFLAFLAGKKGRLSKLLGMGGWTDVRDFPASQGKTFMDQWRGRKGKDL